MHSERHREEDEGGLTFVRLLGRKEEKSVDSSDGRDESYYNQYHSDDQLISNHSEREHEDADRES